jgi:outer membrane protein TolC
MSASPPDAAGSRLARCRTLRSTLFGLLLIAATAHPASGSADDASDLLLLSLRDAVALAADGVDGSGTELASWRSREEEGKLWPEIYLRARYSYETSSIVSLSDQAILGPGMDIERSGLELMLRYDLLQYFASQPQIEAATAEERAAQSRLDVTQRQRMVQAAEAYLTTWSARAQLQALRRYEQRQRRFLADRRRAERQGEAPELGVLRAENDIESTRGEISALEQQAAVSEARLRQVIGFPAMPRLALTFDPKELDLGFIDHEKLEDLVAAAEATSPRLEVARAEVESARWQAQAARAASYPNLEVLASYGRAYDSIRSGPDVQAPTDIESSDDRFWVFLNFKIPLFDGGVRKARASQAEAREKGRLWESQDLARELRALVEEEYWSYVGGMSRSRALERQIALAGRERRHAESRTQAGLGDATEILSADARDARFRMEQVRSRADAYRHGIRLAVATGHNPFRLKTASGEDKVPRATGVNRRAAHGRVDRPVLASFASDLPDHPVPLPATETAAQERPQEVQASAPIPEKQAAPPPAVPSPVERPVAPSTPTSVSAKAEVPDLDQGGFGINLSSSLTPPSSSKLPRLAGLGEYRLYTAEYRSKGKVWHRLRLGFFADRAAAEEVRRRVVGDYPGAWVTPVTTEERQESRIRIVSWDE